jgi:hypothetical protein
MAKANDASILRRLLIAILSIAILMPLSWNPDGNDSMPGI